MAPTNAADRPEHVTATGLRVVGDAVSLFARAERRAELPPGKAADSLFATRLRLRPRLGTGSPVPATLVTLGAAVARHWEDAPPLTAAQPVVRPANRFHGLRWLPDGEPGTWTGELVWRHPHPVLAGAPCTTHVVIVERSGHVSLTVRVTADDGLASIRGNVGAGQARPAFLSELNRTLRLTFDGADAEPRTLGDDDIEQFVRDVLLAESRQCPTAVLAPLEQGGYVVSPELVAEELLGLAHVYRLERHSTTFRLSDALGDPRLSAYWGALRIYMPGFSCAERPEDHPLLVRERLEDPVIRTGLVGLLGRAAASRIEMPPGVKTGDPVAPHDTSVEASLVSPAVAPAPDASRAATSTGAESPHIAPATAERAHTDPATGPASPESILSPTAPSPAALAPHLSATLADSLAPLLVGLGDQIARLSTTIGTLVAANAQLADEVARLRTTNAVRAAGTAALERRVGGLEDLLRQRVLREDDAALETGAAADDRQRPSAPALNDEDGLADDDDSDSTSLVEVLRQAVSAHGDALLVLDAAERAAADSPYEDPERVGIILDAMAEVARRRQEGALGTPLRVAFRELGIDYRGGITPHTPQKLEQQYLVRGSDGVVHDCREHIVLGTSRDPRHCLRIYFTSRAPLEPRFVIGHVGRHFDVLTTD